MSEIEDKLKDAPQWLKDAFVPLPAAIAISRDERLREIDMRVGARLIEKELHQAEYMRGLMDGLYICAIVAFAIYIFFAYREEN